MRTKWKMRPIGPSLCSSHSIRISNIYRRAPCTHEISHGRFLNNSKSYVPVCRCADCCSDRQKSELRNCRATERGILPTLWMSGGCAPTGTRHESRPMRLRKRIELKCVRRARRVGPTAANRARRTSRNVAHARIARYERTRDVC